MLGQNKEVIEFKPIFYINPRPEIAELPDVKEKQKIDVRYVLLEPYVNAHIFWDKENNELVYYVEEPQLDEKELNVLNILENGINELINISFIAMKNTDVVVEYLEKNIRVLLNELKISISKESYLKLMYYIYRDFVGLNEIEPLLKDYYIEDIECNGVNTPIYIVHRKYRNLRTNIIFKDAKELTSFVEKLAQKCGKYISYASPLLDASLPDGSRIQATFTQDISSRGPSFCFADGYLQLNNGEVVKINKLFEKCKNDFGSSFDKENEIVNVTNVGVCGVDENNLKQIDSKLKTIIKLKPPEELVNIGFDDGSEIITTTNHLFHVVDNDLSLLEAHKLKTGLFVPMPSKVDVEGCMQSINIVNLIKEFSYLYKVCLVSNQEIKNIVSNNIDFYKNKSRDYRIQMAQDYTVHNSYFYEILSRGSSISFEVLNEICDLNSLDEINLVVYGGPVKKERKSINVPKILDEELAYLAGAIISDGHLSKYSIDIACYNTGFTNAVTTRLKNKFGKFNVYYNGTRVYLCNLFVPFFFNKIFGIPYGRKAKIVNIPEIIFKSDNKIIAAFLKGLFDGDGTCKSGISYKTSSKELAEQLTYLLARLGLYSKIILKKNMYRVLIPSIYENIYSEKINFCDTFKIKCLSELLLKKGNNAKSYIRHGRVPAKPILNLMKDVGLSKNKASKLCKVSYNRLVHYDSLSKPFVKQIISLIELEIENKGIKNCKLDYIKWLVGCEQEFVKIKHVKIFENKNKIPVYDIELEPCKFFIAGNKPMNIFDTVRKFTKDPWTPVKLMQFKTVSPEILAYLWLLIENEANIMIIGGTGSGKTSFLNSIAFFIPPAARVVSIEDSVTGDSEIIYKNKDKIEKLTIGKLTKLVNSKKINLENIEILTVDDDWKVRFGKPSKFIKHSTNKDIFKITTSTGRIIEVTKDHSLFTLTTSGLVEVKPENLEENVSCIAVPRVLPIEGKGFFDINLINHLNYFNEDFLIGKPIQKILSKYKYNHFKVSKSTHQWWKKRNIIPIRFFKKLKYKFSNDELKKLFIKSKNSTKIPVIFEFDDDFIKLIGLWIGDGSHDNHNRNRTIFSCNEPDCVDIYKRISEKLKINISLMDDNWSWGFNSTIFYKFTKYILNLDGYAKDKKIPDFVYNFTNEQLKHFISGYFSADGTVKKNEVSCCSESRDIINSIQTLLLRFGIISRASKTVRKDNCKELNISSYENINKFKCINFIQKRQNDKLSLIGNSIPTHANSDIIPLNPNWFEELSNYKQYFKDYHNVNNSFPGRTFMTNFISEPSLDIPKECFSFLGKIVNSDLLWDKVVKIEKLPKKSRYVYDISVPGTEKFISQNILLHNTRELALLHENWLPGVTREGVGISNLLGTKEGDITLFDLLRESFRQRPDYVIVGEIRGKEAYVLFQGMSSLRGDEEIFILNNNRPLRIKITELENFDIKNLKAVCYDTENKKAEILPIQAFIKHPKRNTLYKIITKKGREITVTPDHSLFTLKENKIVDIKTNELVIGSKLIIPSNIPCGYNNIDKINLFEYLPDIRVYAPEYIKEASNKLGYYQASALCDCCSITDYYSNFKRSKPSAMKSEKFLKLMSEAKIDFDIKKLEFRYDRKSKSINGFLEINDDFLKLLGYYLSEGSLDDCEGNSSIVLYNKKEAVLEDMRNCIYKLTNNKPNERITEGYGTCLELSFNHKVLFEFIKRNCMKRQGKRIPDFIFGLDKRKIGVFLSALYCGDGTIKQSHFDYYTTSKNLANDVTQLLLVYGIVAKIGKRNRVGRKTTDYEIKFYMSYKKEEFLKYVKPIGKEIDLKVFNKKDYNLLGELYCDEIKSIEILELDKPEYVYDVSVPKNQNFIAGFGGILAHNSGHPSFGTMHAEDVETMVRRLETPPIELSPSLVESLDAVCVITQAKVDNKDVRRIREVVEIIKINEGSNVDTNTPFTWDPKTDNFYFKEESKVFDKIVLHKGISKEKLYREFILRTKLLMALYARNITGFKEVYDIINAYYKTPELVLKKFNVS